MKYPKLCNQCLLNVGDVIEIGGPMNSSGIPDGTMLVITELVVTTNEEATCHYKLNNMDFEMGETVAQVLYQTVRGPIWPAETLNGYKEVEVVRKYNGRRILEWKK